MDKEMLTSAIEALLFAAGKPLNTNVLSNILEQDKKEIEEALQNLRIKLAERNSGIQLIKVNESYQLCTLEVFYDYVCKLLDNRPKPTLSQAALEVLSIVAYNPRVTRAEMEKIRGVSSDSAMNKLLEYNLIEEAGKQDLPGKPMGYQTTDEFLKMFGIESLKELPELPKLKEELDQVKIDDVDAKDDDTQ
ncbi:MAG: SMC-Scp complex subunit ScpB [Clostridia bacterium]|nr:SMC-Scp complex subunit ScpB [Clostridia bacterium]